MSRFILLPSHFSFVPFAYVRLTEARPIMQWFLLASSLLLGHVSAATAITRQAPLVHTQNTTDVDCKCFPGDECWPSAAEWSALNTTVDGRLIATVPLGSPCHDPGYDEEQCAYLQEQWTYTGIQ